MLGTYSIPDLQPQLTCKCISSYGLEIPLAHGLELPLRGTTLTRTDELASQVVKTLRNFLTSDFLVNKEA